MQPESSAPPNTADNENLSQPREPISQHGFHDYGTPVSRQSAAGAEAGTTTAASADQFALNSALAASLQELAGTAQSGEQSRGLRSQNTPSPPARNRIAEYEKASTTPPVKRREGPAFEVIKKPRNPNDKRSPIQELPNEVLTHSLAHLTPNDLASVSLVSKRFHELVNGPHAWRTAFARFFPGPDSINASLQDEDETQAVVRSDRRAFTRLTAIASWRSEYILRTRLLRSLSRGKPVQSASNPQSPRSGHGNAAMSTITYNAHLLSTINHIHANFGAGLNKRLPRFVHGSDDAGTATSSDPNAAKVDSWGLSDPQFFLQFTERFPGDAQYGLGPGETVGVPNSMDTSQPYGMVVGEGSPGGMTYYRSSDEMRGRFLLFSSATSEPEAGIPRILASTEAVSTVWIAKSAAIPSLTDGLIGILSGSSQGVLTAYSLGSTNGNNRDNRLARGELTARWVLSPGVPIIAIAVDNEYSLKRQAQNRIWAVVLNAFGEVFYLTKFPRRPHIDRGTRMDDESLQRTAWLTGRTVYWNAVEPSRRTAKLDPYASASVDGSYSPRSSWNGMCLSKDQIQAETHEIEAFAARKPKDFQHICSGWDMQRKLEVDFAGDDGHNAGEHVIVFDCGLEEHTAAAITRYSRTRYQEKTAFDTNSTPPLTAGSTEASSPPSLFGATGSPARAPTPSFSFDRLEDTFAQDDFTGSITPRPMSEEWRTSVFSFDRLRHVQILATALDESTFATQTASEDPLLSFSGPSTASSPSLTPMSANEVPRDQADVPGQRARLFAAGTALGTVLLWNIRAPVSRSTDNVNAIEPVRIIRTESPQIACLALTSLCLVHGGNDGLVQAWDLLASDTSPVRTLNSRYSSRARRRLVQAQASPQGVGINLFAAGAICLDPDPTVLRGIVSLGTQLLYWSYSSSAADQYKSQKRRLRRSERGSNNGGERFSGATRTNLKDYIANEQFELDREKQQRKKETQRFAGRFGTELLGGSEEEMLAYATMLSEETLQQEKLRRGSDTSTVTSTAASSSDLTPAQSPSPPLSTPKSDEELDADIAEAIRQSLATSPTPSHDIHIRHAKLKKGKGSSAMASPQVSPHLAGSSKASEMNDLEFAIQLSLAEEQSKQAVEQESFPSLAGSNSKGKGRMA